MKHSLIWQEKKKLVIGNVYYWLGAELITSQSLAYLIPTAYFCRYDNYPHF